MLKYVHADVQISENHIQRVNVPEWEVAILQVVHPRADVVLAGEQLVDRPAPDAADEFRRLVNRYGYVQTEDGGKGPPYVAAVYGQFGVGNTALGQAIAKATIAEVPAANPATLDDLLGTGRQEQVSSVGG